LRFVDSNVFIYHMAQDPRYGATATRILERIEEGEEAATSTLVIAQVCSYLRWGKREEVIPIYLGFLRSLPNLVKVDTIFEDLVEAVEMSRKLDLGWRTWDDLVIAAQMARMGVMEIYSNDRDFDEILGVKRIFD
jgi:predicted nucleic acid-binding protein